MPSNHHNPSTTSYKPRTATKHTLMISLPHTNKISLKIDSNNSISMIKSITSLYKAKISLYSSCNPITSVAAV